MNNTINDPFLTAKFRVVNDRSIAYC